MYIQVVDSEESAASEGSPQPIAGTVQELKRQLGEATQRADNDLAVCPPADLAEAQAASHKLQQRCLQLEADMADLQARSQLPCMPRVSPDFCLVCVPCCTWVHAPAACQFV